MKNKLKTGLLLVLSLAIFTACGKPSATNHELRTANLVHNGNFEQGTGSPDGWHTHNQFLSDVTGWTTDESHSGKHSLKIENIGGSNAYWQGDSIILKKPISSFGISVWTKAKDIKDVKGRFQMVFDVTLKNHDGNLVPQTVSVDLPKDTSSWKETQKSFIFDSDISKVTPYFKLMGTPGTVWIDDFRVSPIKIDVNNSKSLKILFDSNINKMSINENELISTKNSEKLYKIEGSRTILGSDFILAEQDSIYELSGDFKSVGVNPSLVYFGIDCYDKEKRSIPTHSFMYFENTETELVRGCKGTDTAIYIKNGQSWVKSYDECIAFDIDDSGCFNDLPNFNTSSFNIKSITKLGDECWKVELSNPCGKSYPKGTKVREHKSRGGHIYSSISGIVSGKWTEYKGIVFGESAGYYRYQIYPKTKYIKIILIGNCNQSTDSALQFKNIKFKEIFKEIQK